MMLNETLEADRDHQRDKHDAYEQGYNDGYEQGVKDAREQPKQRTGHWIPVGVAEVVGGESAQWGSAIAYHKCSECDEQALRDDFGQEVLSKWCPHCWAKMEWVSEGEAE